MYIKKHFYYEDQRQEREVQRLNQKKMYFRSDLEREAFFLRERNKNMNVKNENLAI